jgi:hypothetical protein
MGLLMKNGMTIEEYTDFVNHLFLQEMIDTDYLGDIIKKRFPNGITVKQTR